MNHCSDVLVGRDTRDCILGQRASTEEIWHWLSCINSRWTCKRAFSPYDSYLIAGVRTMDCRERNREMTQGDQQRLGNDGTQAYLLLSLSLQESARRPRETTKHQFVESRKIIQPDIVIRGQSSNEELSTEICR